MEVCIYLVQGGGDGDGEGVEGEEGGLGGRLLEQEYVAITTLPSPRIHGQQEKSLQSSPEQRLLRRQILRTYVRACMHGYMNTILL